jgi:hypothetical protein
MFILVLFYRYDRVNVSLWIQYPGILLGEGQQLTSIHLQIILWLRNANTPHLPFPLLWLHNRWVDYAPTVDRLSSAPLPKWSYKRRWDPACASPQLFQPTTHFLRTQNTMSMSSTTAIRSSSSTAHLWHSAGRWFPWRALCGCPAPLRPLLVSTSDPHRLTIKASNAATIHHHGLAEPRRSAALRWRRENL